MQVFNTSYTLKYETNISFHVEDDQLRLKVSSTAPTTGETFPDAPAVSFPLQLFRDTNGELNEPLIEQFCRTVSTVFANTINQSLFRDAAFHLILCAHITALDKNFQLTDDSYDTVFPMLANFHTDIIFERLRSLTGQRASGKGRQAKWTPEFLAHSIVMAMRKRKPSHRTYTEIALILEKDCPNQFKGKTSSALKKLVARYDLDWDEMKKRADLSDSELIHSLPPEFLEIIEAAALQESPRHQQV